MVVRPLVIAAALRGHPRRLVAFRLAAWAVAGAPLWLIGALGTHSLRLPLWAAALTVDYLAWALGWPLPWLRAAVVNRWRIAGEHLADRHQQIFLIALGESILVIGAGFSGVGYSAGRAAAFAVAFTTTALLWRIYFHRAGGLLTEALGRARMPGQLGKASERTHALMVLSVLVTAVGYELVIAHPYGRPRPTWLLFVVGGPVLFLVARVRLEYEIFGRVSRSRMIGLVVLLLVTAALARWAPMVGLSVVAGVLALVALLDAVRSRQRPLEDSASPIGREMPGSHGSEA
jgi:low temperature requirement protein LtrA